MALLGTSQGGEGGMISPSVQKIIVIAFMLKANDGWRVLRLNTL